MEHEMDKVKALALEASQFLDEAYQQPSRGGEKERDRLILKALDASKEALREYEKGAAMTDRVKEKALEACRATVTRNTYTAQEERARKLADEALRLHAEQEKGGDVKEIPQELVRRMAAIFTEEWTTEEFEFIRRQLNTLTPPAEATKPAEPMEAGKESLLKLLVQEHRAKHPHTTCVLCERYEALTKPAEPDPAEVGYRAFLRCKGCPDDADFKGHAAAHFRAAYAAVESKPAEPDPAEVAAKAIEEHAKMYGLMFPIASVVAGCIRNAYAPVLGKHEADREKLRR